MLPARLPQPHTQVDLADEGSRIFLYRSQELDWAPLGRAASLIVTTVHPSPEPSAQPSVHPSVHPSTQPSAKPVRVGLLIDQSAKTRGLSEMATRDVLPSRAPTYMFGPQGRHNVGLQAGWVRVMTALADWVRTGEVAAAASTWTVTQCRAWFKWFDAGITDPADRAALEAIGVRATTGARNHIGLVSVRRLLDAGMSVNEAIRWLPHLPRTGETIGMRMAFQRGMTFDDVAPYLGTRLDPTAPTRGEGSLAERLDEIARTLTQGWTPQGRTAVDAQAPEGCTAAVWADLWTQFMPASLASAYATAGIPYATAVRLHLSEQDPTPAALATLTALRT